MRLFQTRKSTEEYLPTLPRQAFAGLMLAVFFTQASVMVDLDLMNGLRGPFWWVLTKGTVYGLAVVLSLMTTRHKKKGVSKAALAIAVILVLISGQIDARLAQQLSLGAPAQQDIRSRVALDGTISLVGLILGYVLFFRSLVSQGIKHVRTRAELALAEQVQQALAPPLATRTSGYEIHGVSAPSSQMGGDLLDAVDDPSGMAVYVADVAGHGIQAGVFMGMVKSSVRTALLRTGPMSGLLGDLNRVVFDVKPTSATYVTFACLRCGEDGRVEYSLAGSGPVLLYRARSKTTTQLGMEQFPLGLFGNATFHSGVVEIEPEDILALLTDGLPETEDANNEQFGLDRIGQMIASMSAASLSTITTSVFEAVRRHGLQTDDETLVLVRASGPSAHSKHTRTVQAG